MSRINQIQIRYTAVEDRIVLRMNTEESSEFRFWITRRYAKLLAASLLNLLNATDAIQEFEQEDVKKAVMSFIHEEAVARADFAKTFQAQPKNLPLGDEPVLLSELSVSRTDDGNPLLRMYPEEGKGIDLALPQPLLHSVSKLFADALHEADWGVEFTLTENGYARERDKVPALLN